MPSASVALRLPGVYFLPTPAPPGNLLPPLDVAAFVGFAERGVTDFPVGLDDYADYKAIFGGDLALARAAKGEVLYAHLAPSVAAFFFKWRAAVLCSTHCGRGRITGGLAGSRNGANQRGGAGVPCKD